MEGRPCFCFVISLRLFLGTCFGSSVPLHLCFFISNHRSEVARLFVLDFGAITG